MKKLLILAVLTISGCASLCDPGDTQCRQNANDNAEAVGVGIGAALDILAIPDETTTTQTRTCSRDRLNNEICSTTTIKGN